MKRMEFEELTTDHMGQITIFNEKSGRVKN